MYKPETESNNVMRSIANYENFGLRENDKYPWVSTLVEMGEDFFPWRDGHPLGKNMVKSAARIWFTQAGLITEGSKKTTSLVEVFKNFGGEVVLGWEFIWVALVNNSALVKWFVTATETDKPYTIEQLSEMLANSSPSLGKSTIDGGLAALKDMFTKSPLGGENTVTLPIMKGRTVQNLTRKSKAVNPLTLLYGMYLVAVKAERGSFTVRELLTADKESIFVSPLVAFGISPDTFKKQCEGLKSKYPDYIETTFTHGNDEITVFPKKHTIEDIITLALGE